MSKKNHIHAIALSSQNTPSPTWAIQVQPKNPATKWFSIGTSNNTSPTSTIYSSAGKINDMSPSAITLRILLGENEHPSITEKVAAALQPHSVAEPPHHDTWLGYAATALQQAGLIDHFEIAAFVNLATQTLQQRYAAGEEGHEKAVDGIVEIDHEGRPIRRASAASETGTTAESKKKGKKGGKGFWVSYGPHVSGHGAKSREASRRNSWERQDEAYGGLM